VDRSAFTRLRRLFLKTPTEQWGVGLSAVGVAVCHVILIVLLYLYVDLITYRGQIPELWQLNAARQKEFADDWARAGETDRFAAVQRLTSAEPQMSRLVSADAPIPPLTPAEAELRWQAGVYLILRERVSQSAADAHLPPDALGGGGSSQAGVLSLVVRERHRWTGHLVGWLASWNPWMWRPEVKSTTLGGADGGNPNLTYLLGLLIASFAVAAAFGLLMNVQAYLTAAVTIEFLTRLRRAIYLHTYRLGSLATRTAGPEEATRLFTRQADAVGAAVHASLGSAFRYPIEVVGLLALILLVNFWLAVSFLLLTALVWVIGGQITAHLRREARVASRQAEFSLAVLVESLGLVQLVKGCQMERFNQNRVERQLAEFGRSGWRKFRGNALAGPLLGAVALLAGVSLLYLAARSVLAGESTVAGLVVLVTALVTMAPPIAGWVDARLRLRRGREAAEAIEEYLDRRGEAAEAADAEYLPVLTTRIEYRSVSLREPGTGEVLLDGISFAIPAGAQVAIVGRDPAAKRALALLLARFLDPTGGEIRIEDKNIRWVTHQSLRAQVAVVLQDELTFTDTVANNIGCGDPQYTLPQIIEAAKLAHAHQFIEKLPYGYETVVGELGRVLRPGERFRLAMARALLRDPSILVIEEPVGPIDEDTLALFDDTIERAAHGRTIVFLATRLHTLRTVDRVFLIADRKLEASGTHRDLWQTNETYRRLQLFADASAELAEAKE
jgi:ATP-binding cassette subfamily B protein